MKAATLNKQCRSSRGATAPYANARRLAGVHHPRRRTTQASHGLYGRDATHLPASLNDAEEQYEPVEIDIDQTIPRVLLVDRDVETAAALTTLLVPEAQVIHAGSIAEARRLLETQLFSMIIIDPSLPDGNGAIVINAVEHTPILVYSATEPVKFDKLPYLSKPYTTPRELWSMISRLLGIGGLIVSED